MLVYSVMYVLLSDVNKGHLPIIWIKSYKISSRYVIVYIIMIIIAAVNLEENEKF